MQPLSDIYKEKLFSEYISDYVDTLDNMIEHRI